jgi:hypothetical protein
MIARGITTKGALLSRAETATEHRPSRWIEFFMGPAKLANEYVDTHGRKISEVMTADPRTITEETVKRTVGLLERKRTKRLPVSGEGDRRYR